MTTITSPKVVVVPTFTADIYIAGDYERALRFCRYYCDSVGLCVNISPCEYVYTGGREAGVKVGLINYPRFPSLPIDLLNKATTLGDCLAEELNQESYSIVTPDQTIWKSWRAADVTKELKK